MYICNEHPMYISQIAIFTYSKCRYLEPELRHIVHDMVYDWVTMVPRRQSEKRLRTIRNLFLCGLFRRPKRGNTRPPENAIEETRKRRKTQGQKQEEQRRPPSPRKKKKEKSPTPKIWRKNCSDPRRKEKKKINSTPKTRRKAVLQAEKVKKKGRKTAQLQG